MKRLSVIGLVAVFVVFFLSSFLFAADKSTEKTAAKSGPTQSVLTAPAKVTVVKSGENAAPSKTAETSVAKETAAKKVTTENTLPKEKTPVKTVKDMTKDELVGSIKDTLDREASIMTFMPEIKKVKDPAGKFFYTYQGAKLDSLDRDKLEQIFGRVHAEAARIRTDRLNRDMANLKRVQSASSAGGVRGLNTPQLPHIQTPNTYTPPRPTNIPKLPTRY